MNENISAFQKLTFLAGILPLAASIIASPFLSEVSYSYQAIPFLLSMVFLGLPHGAMDHIVPRMLEGVSKKKSVASIVLVYMVLGGLYAVLWLLSPILSLGLFILLTWFHWGQGDLYILREFGFERLTDSSLFRTCSLILRGGIPMLVPFIAHPEQYIWFLSSLLERFSTEVIIGDLLTADLRLVLLTFLGTLTAANFLKGFLRTSTQEDLKIWLYDNFEILLLWIFFIALPPLLALGIYFCFWHSVRHLARLSLVEDSRMRRNIIAGDWLNYLKKLGRNTIMITTISLLIFAFLSLFLIKDYTVLSVVAAYLVFISVVTLPHTIVVTWMDYREFRT